MEYPDASRPATCSGKIPARLFELERPSPTWHAPRLDSIRLYRKLYSMKATLDIPDELYRRVKARSAMEGRPFRAVAVELLQNWLSAPMPTPAKEAEVSGYNSAPWLAITRRSLQPGMRHQMESIRPAITAAWSLEAADKAPSVPDSRRA